MIKCCWNLNRISMESQRNLNAQKWWFCFIHPSKIGISTESQQNLNAQKWWFCSIHPSKIGISTESQRNLNAQEWWFCFIHPSKIGISTESQRSKVVVFLHTNEKKTKQGCATLTFSMIHSSKLAETQRTISTQNSTHEIIKIYEILHPNLKNK